MIAHSMGRCWNRSCGWSVIPAPVTGPRDWSQSTCRTCGRGFATEPVCPNGQGLIKARTNEDHWLFGELLRSRSTTSVDVDPAAVKTVRDKAFVIFDEALGFPGNLPGILDVLPPDRRRQQLEQAASFFNNLADIIDKVSSVVC
ncbi:MAG: hypothetical protein JWQ99_1319 [Blastococcus sp.]|jgi:hypothetical protein|nr:hypothetical protein [Blastococcus sp.]